MKTLKTLALATAVSAGLLGSVSAIAATNPGAPSATSSTGDFIINLNINTSIEISGLQDIDLLYTPGETVAKAGLDFCVESNAQQYQITASGSYGANTDAFKLIQGNTDTVDYKVYFADSVSVDNTGTELFHDTPNNNATNGWTPDSMNSNCTTNKASVFVETSSSFNDYQGAFDGTLTLTVEII